MDVQSKNYTNSSLPLWGIEIANGNYTIEDINLLWGLVDDSLINVSVIQTSRAAEIYLPATTHSVTFGHVYDSFASGIAFSAAWNSVYEYAAAIRGIGVDFIPRCTPLHLRQLSTFADTLHPRSYSGETNYGLTLKYRNLSRTPAGAANMLNLIWTDLAAFFVVGTKTGFEPGEEQPGASQLRKRNTSPSYLGNREVHRHVRVIEYKNILYAIPAFIGGGLFILGLITALLMFCFRTVSWETLNHYVNHTSMGRAMTQIISPEVAEPTATTKEWSETAGKVNLEIPGIIDHKDVETPGGRLPARRRRNVRSRKQLGQYQDIS